MTQCFASRSGLLAASVAAICIAPACAQTLNWMTPRQLSGQQGHAMAYDLARQRIVLFGGADRTGASGVDHTAGNFAGTWEWDGGNWTQRAPVTSPPGRRYHAMACDLGRQRVVLFGGEDLTRSVPRGTSVPFLLSDTWEWDGNDWTQRSPATAPSSREGHAMAYDIVRQRIVLFGGWLGTIGSVLADTWEWDGSDWNLQTPATSPSARAFHAMAYDLPRQRTVLFGGLFPSDTWEWDGSNWTQRSPATSPSGRFGHAMAFDVARARVVMFGGNGTPALADTWEWDGSDWTQRTPATNPRGLAFHAMACDLVRGRVVMFGNSDTWEWNGSDWTQLSRSASPGERAYHAMAYDDARQRNVLFGGWDAAFNPLADTWERDGSNWTLRAPSTSPGARSRHAMAYDVARQRVVLFGGRSNGNAFADTWEWDGSDWTQRSPAVSPGARSGHAMACDVAHQRIVLFGGEVGVTFLSDTWEWDGSSWTLRSPPTSPGPRSGHAMACDVARGRTVMFGGAGNFNFTDTWEWDGTGWTQRMPSTRPGIRRGHAMVYDLARQRVVLFGGWDLGLTYLSDTWEWNGSNWTRVTTPTSQTEHVGHAMTYDVARQRIVLFGGARGAASDDTWLFGPLTPTQAQRFGTACAGSSAPPVLGSNAPYLGNPAFALDLLSTYANTPCVFGVATATQSLPIGPCTLLLQDPIQLQLAFTNAYGFASTPTMALPLDIALRGATFHAQAVVVDPLATTGLAFTAGLRLVLGD